MQPLNTPEFWALYLIGLPGFVLWFIKTYMDPDDPRVQGPIRHMILMVLFVLSTGALSHWLFVAAAQLVGMLNPIVALLAGWQAMDAVGMLMRSKMKHAAAVAERIERINGGSPP